MDRLKHLMRDYVNALMDRALAEGHNPPPLDVARRWMHEDTIDAMPCSSCGEPVLDMPGHENVHVHTFRLACDEGAITGRLVEAARGVREAELELEDAALGWLTHRTREMYDDVSQIRVEVEWEIEKGTPIITAHVTGLHVEPGNTIVDDHSAGIFDPLDAQLADWLPEFIEAAKLEAGTHWIELHP